MNDSDVVLDMATVNELIAMLEDGVYELFEEYMRNAVELIPQLEEAARQGDSLSLQYLAHSLKGSSGNLGITNVYRLSLMLEREAAGDGAVSFADEKVSEIAEAVTRANEALLALMPQTH